MRTIGDFARATGLSVSALRFYDGAGVLVPAAVDPVTGYRRYADGQVRAARLIAGLRRAGMPVAEIAATVAELGDTGAVRARVDRHRRRLEDGLADAVRELLRVHTLLDLEERPMTRITLDGRALAAALGAVRFAAGTDPELPMLGGILFETGDDELTLVATDRYRLAVATTPAAVDGPPARHLMPIDAVDRLPRSGPVTIDLPAEPDEYPDHRRLTAMTGGRRITVDAAALRSQVLAAPLATRELDGSPYRVTILTLDDTGSVRFTPESEWAADAAGHTAVNREFLLEALDAGGPGQLELQLDGPIRPLAVRVVGDDSRMSILMPVRN